MRTTFVKATTLAVILTLVISQAALANQSTLLAYTANRGQVEESWGSIYDLPGVESLFHSGDSSWSWGSASSAVYASHGLLWSHGTVESSEERHFLVAPRTYSVSIARDYITNTASEPLVLRFNLRPVWQISTSYSDYDYSSYCFFAFYVNMTDGVQFSVGRDWGASNMNSMEVVLSPGQRINIYAHVDTNAQTTDVVGRATVSAALYYQIESRLSSSDQWQTGAQYFSTASGYDYAIIPEPASMLLLGAGVSAMALMRRRERPPITDAL
jgi:hypothetical protein